MIKNDDWKRIQRIRRYCREKKTKSDYYYLIKHTQKSTTNRRSYLRGLLDNNFLRKDDDYSFKNKLY